MLGQNPELKTLRSSAYSSQRGCFGWMQSYILEAEAGRALSSEASLMYRVSSRPARALRHHDQLKKKKICDYYFFFEKAHRFFTPRKAYLNIK